MDDNVAQDLIAELKAFRETVGTLTQQVGNYSASVNQRAKVETINVKIFEDKIKALNTALDSNTRKETEAAIQRLKNINSLEQLSGREKELILQEQRYRIQNVDDFKKYGKAVRDAADDTQNLSKELKAIAIGGLYNFREALLSSEKSLSKYQSTIDSLGKATEGLVDVIGIGGKYGMALKALIATTFYLEKQALAYGDAILKNKDQLADMGAVGTYTSQELMNMAKNAGFTSKTLEGWTKATRSLGSSMAILGGTVNQNLETWNKLATVSDEQLANYRAMGFSTEEVAQTTADYVQLLSKQNTIVTDQMRRDGALRKGADEYLKTLVDLTQVTGKSRDEAKKTLEVASAQREFNVRLNVLNQERVRLEKIANDQSKSSEEREAARARAQKIGAQIESQQRVLRGATEAGGPEMAALVAKYLGTGGVITSAEQVRQFSPEMIKLMQGAMRGEEVKQGRVEDLLGARLNENIRRFGPLAVIANDELGKQLGTFNETLMKTGTIGITNQAAGTSQQQKFEQARAITEAGVTGQTPAAQADNAEKLRKAMEYAERAAQRLADVASERMLENQKALITALELMKKASEFAAKNLDLLAAAALAAAFAMGAKDLYGALRGRGGAPGAPGGGPGGPGRPGAPLPGTGGTVPPGTGAGRGAPTPPTASPRPGAPTAVGPIQLPPSSLPPGPTSQLPGPAPAGGAPASGGSKLMNIFKGGIGVAARGGIAGTLASLSFGFGANAAERAGHTRTAGVLDVGSEAATYAGLGAAAGSFVPVVGTAVGGAVGLAGGAAYGLYKNWSKIFGSKPPATPEQARAMVDQDPEKVISSLIKFGGESGSERNFRMLDPTFGESFVRMIAEHGQPVQINSAFRDPQKQKELYDAWIASGKRGNPVAPPGHSKHNIGRAIDINSDQVAALAGSGLLAKYGFNTIPNDPPHIEMARTGATFTGPSSGYPVMLHGRETVVPTPNPNTMLASVDVEKEPPRVRNTAPGELFGSSVGVASSDKMADAISSLAKKLDSIDQRMATLNSTNEKVYHALA